MLDDKTIIPVINRNCGSTAYEIKEMGGLLRDFSAGETKRITMEELRKLSYIPGGEYILQNYFVLLNEEAVEELIGEVEPEYYYTEEDIVKLLSEGSLDELEDCINFAPQGVIRVLKDTAVKIKLNDMTKRELIYEKIGFNVDNAIKNNKYAEMVEEKKEDKKVRKAQVAETKSEDDAPKRKAAAPAASKYKVIETK